MSTNDGRTTNGYQRAASYFSDGLADERALEAYAQQLGKATRRTWSSIYSEWRETAMQQTRRWLDEQILLPPPGDGSQHVDPAAAARGRYHALRDMRRALMPLMTAADERCRALEREIDLPTNP